MVPRRLNTVLALFLGGMLAIHLAMAWIVKDQIAEGRPDFLIYYCEGRIFRSTQPPQLYNESLQAKLQYETAASGWTPPQVKPYMHPPFEVLLFVPFSLLPFTSAYLLWTVFNLVFLGVCIFLLKRAFRSKTSLVWGILAALAFFPVFLTILEGQDTCFVLLAYSAALVALRKKCDLSAGACLGLGLVRPHLILPFVFVGMLRGKWRLFVGFATSCAAASLLSITVAGWHGFLHYPRYIWSLEHTRSTLVIPPQYIPNLRGFIDYFFRNLDGPRVLLSINVLLSLLALMWASRKWATAERKQQFSSLGFSLALLVASLVSYHEFIYDFTVLLIPILALVHGPQRSTTGTRWYFLPAVVLFLTPLYILLWYRLGLLNLMSLVEVALAYCISRAISERERSTSGPE